VVTTVRGKSCLQSQNAIVLYPEENGNEAISCLLRCIQHV